MPMTAKKPKKSAAVQHRDVESKASHRKVAAASGRRQPSRRRSPAKTAMVMAVAQPPRDLLREVERVVARGSEITIVQGTSSVKVSGQTLTAVRQLLSALNSGPITVQFGDVHDTELTSQETADYLNVSRPHVVKLAREGRLPHKRVGNRHRFLLSDVQEFERQRRLEREETLTTLTPEAGYAAEDF
jgi:excisionase family DNA binding protein